MVNVHLDEKKISSNESINNLLTQKIGSKVFAKKLNEYPNVFLVPVLWGQFDEIKPIHEYYAATKRTFSNTIQPTCFMTFTDPNGNRVHRFGTIDTIFEEMKF